MIRLEECRFSYGRFNSFFNTDLPDMMFAHIDTEEVRVISGRKTGEFVFNKASKSRYLVGDSYDDSALEFDVEIVTCDGSTLSLSQIRYVERALFSNSVFQRLNLYLIDASGEIETDEEYWSYLNCRFLYPEKIFSNGGVIGFRCTLQTDSMMMWSDGYIRFDFDDEVIVDSDTGTEIIKGDADGDGEITVNDVIICRAVAAYGMSKNETGDPVYSIHDFFDNNRNVIAANQSILNKLPLAKPITFESLQRCLIACCPSYTQFAYDSHAVLDFRDISSDYADVIMAKIAARADQTDPEEESYYSVPIMKMDADGDGVVTAADASICLKVATWGTSLFTVSDFFDNDGNVVPSKEEALNSLPLPKPITKESFLRCLVACDLSYTQEDFDGGEPLPDISDISYDDAQNILKAYVQSVADQTPVETDIINISAASDRGVGIVRAVGVNVDSYGDGYVYPVIRLLTGSVGGSIEIENRSDSRKGVYESSDRKTVISNVPPSTLITIESDISMITGVPYNKMTKKYFPRLINGNNIFYIRGDVSAIDFSWKVKLFI